MCGIFGCILNADSAVTDTIAGLKNLEYRGYDSSGVAYHNGTVRVEKAEGKIVNLQEKIDKLQDVNASLAIGHTRWATHGKPTENNAHPHIDDAGKIAVVHNGIIENYLELKEMLQGQGAEFYSESDTETLPKLIAHELKSASSEREAFENAIKKLKGAFAIAVIFESLPNEIFVARLGSPLAIGYSDSGVYVGSDSIAISPFAKQICYLEDGDIGFLNLNETVIKDENFQIVKRDIVQTNLSGAAVGKDNYKHFMLKEIHEQPTVISQTLAQFYRPVSNTLKIDGFDFDVKKLRKINIVACGTAYYAGCVAKYWLEKNAKISVEVDIASEFRYRDPVIEKDSIGIFISQSGETADTMAALKYAKSQGQYTIGVLNSPESSMAKLVDCVLPTLAGPEIGVASTKAFTTQLTVLACFAIFLADQKNLVEASEKQEVFADFMKIPQRIGYILHEVEEIQKIAHSLKDSASVLYIGRNSLYPIAMEGALKLKEISYIHAESYAAGELKHGPIALLDENMPVVVFLPDGELFEKTASNIEEIIARGAKLYLFGDCEGCSKFKDKANACFEVQEIHEFLNPIIYTIPAQLLAYFVAVEKGTDVDQPRNLAKSVTVE